MFLFFIIQIETQALSMHGKKSRLSCKRFAQSTASSACRARSVALCPSTQSTHRDPLLVHTNNSPFRCDADKDRDSALDRRFKLQLDAFVSSFRERLEVLEDIEVAEKLSSRSRDDRLRSLYAIFSDDSGALPPIVISDEQSIRGAVMSSERTSRQQKNLAVQAYARRSQSSGSSCGVSPSVRSPPPSPSQEQHPSHVVSPSRTTSLTQQAFLVSPIKTEQEAIDRCSPDIAPQDCVVESRSHVALSTSPPPRPPELTDDAGCTALEERDVAEFALFSARKQKNCLSSVPSFFALPSQTAVDLNPSDDPSAFIRWISEQNVFRYLDSHENEVQQFQAHVIESVAQEVCRNDVEAVVLEVLAAASS